MSETSNIANLADKVSSDIFKWLKWGISPIKDEDFNCDKENKHNKKTHPVDVVFNYEHPYNGKTIFVNTDLKSYKSTSITTNTVRSSLKSLAMTIECALVSEGWTKKYVHNCESWDVIGLLFIFNYDNDYDKNFTKILSQISLDSLNIKKNQKLIVFGSEIINYLLNLVEDLRKAVQDRRKFDETAYDFYYPNLVENKTHTLRSFPATVEYILSAFVIVKFNKENDRDYLIYYKEKGDTVEEFTYLIDTLLSYQILIPENKLELVFYNPNNSTDPMVNFNIAKINYAKTWGMRANDPIFEAITARVMTTKVHYYDPLNERMTNESS